MIPNDEQVGRAVIPYVYGNNCSVATNFDFGAQAHKGTQVKAKGCASLLDNLIPPSQTVAPIWELRVGEYRVFYDVSASESVVYVRAVQRKPRGAKTEDIL